MYCDLIEKLIDLGAEELNAHLVYLEHKEFDAAHYHKGSWRAMLDVAEKLFNIERADFRGMCAERREEISEGDGFAPLTSVLYWNCECADKYIHKVEIEKCPVCGAERDVMPDSLVSEVTEGTHFAEG